MGNCTSQEEEASAKQRADEISKQLKDDGSRSSREVKILLLGVSSSPYLKGRRLSV
jgi:hypothetical protein